MYYQTLFGILYLISLLPFWILYRISDFLYLWVAFVFRYRRHIIDQNLEAAFPGLPKVEISRIRNRFYRHFCDIFIEVLTLFSISPQQLQKRIRLSNPEAFREVSESGRGSLLLASHFGNFEWMTAAMSISIPFPGYGIYSPLKSGFAEFLIVRLRTRWGMGLIPMKEAIKGSLRILEKVSMIGYINDQSPARGRQLYFTSFLGRPTATHEGISLLSLRKELPVFFADIRKVGRGRYTLALVRLPFEDFVPLSDQNMHAFTDYQAKVLESVIRERPEYWLWSHRRWKHSPREGDTLSPALTSNQDNKFA
jgi:KDO2-lipid IV(A) lauroyltransferase